MHEVGPGVVYDSGGVRVTAFQVDHGEWREAYGYRIDTPRPEHRAVGRHPAE